VVTQVGVTVMPFNVIVGDDGGGSGWAFTDCIGGVLGVCFGRVSGGPSCRIRFFHRYFHAVLSRGCYCLALLRRWRFYFGFMFWLSKASWLAVDHQMVWMIDLHLLLSVEGVSRSECFGLFLPLVRSLPGCIPSNSTTT